MSEQLIYLFYLVMGAAGTAARVALTPSLEFGLNRRTVVEVAAGGASGAVLAWFGPLLVKAAGFPELAGTMPVFIRGLVVFVVSVAGSVAVDKLILQRFLPPKA